MFIRKTEIIKIFCKKEQRSVPLLEKEVELFFLYFASTIVVVIFTFYLKKLSLPVFESVVVV